MNARANIPSENTNDTFHIAIIGAGFSGLGLGIKLKQAGINCFTIYEKAYEVGGTWRDNVYPGAECDVPSHLYSYSFEKNPNWSKMFGTQPEIQDYLLACTEKYQLRPHLQFNTEACNQTFDETSGLWTIDTLIDGANRDKIIANVVVACQGGLSLPKLPDIKGLDQFEGKLMHTANWDKEYSLDDKHVAVIGTGASAIQTIPAIQPIVEQLTVFQRTPAWVLPKDGSLFPSGFKKNLQRFPILRSIMRYSIYWFMEMAVPSLIFNFANSGRMFEKLALKSMRANVSDPQLRAKLVPNYHIGCKRMLISGDYYPAMAAENTEVITDNIKEINKTSIITNNGREFPVDTIICATGFDVPTSGMKYEVIGRNGQRLNDVFKAAGGSEGYKGMSYSGFPNLFTIMGPNTGPGHTSVIVYAEGQMNYITQAIKNMLKKNIKLIDVRKPVQDKFNKGVQARMQHTVWTSGCNSWYLTDEGKNTTLWPGFSFEYRLRVLRYKSDEYELVAKTAADNEALPINNQA